MADGDDASVTLGAAASVGRTADASALASALKDTLTTAKDPSSPAITNTASGGDTTLLTASLSPATKPATDAAQSTQSPDVPLTLGAPGWEKELGQRVAWMMQNQVHRAELQVTPAHLGPLNLQIELNGSQASVSFTTPHAAVQETIQSALPQLREMLEAQGLQLAGAGVHQQGAGDNTGGWQAQQQEVTRSWGRRSDTTVETETSISAVSSSRSLVDYFA